MELFSGRISSGRTTSFMVYGQLWRRFISKRRGGGIYYWDTSAGTSSRAVDITTLSGNNQPQVANIVLVSERDRHVIAFGCDPQGDPGNLTL